MSPEKAQQIVDLYRSGKSIHQIAPIIGCAFQSVSRRLRMAGVSTRDRSAATRAGRAINPDSGRKYSCNHSYFSLIDTHEKAYWLGFLAADGCVLDTGIVQLSCSVNDRTHVIRFRDALESSYPVYDYPCRSAKRGQGATVLAFLSLPMALDLIALGVHPRKTKTLRWPTGVPDELLDSFVLGYLDGDGCINGSRGAHPLITVGFAGNPQFLADLRDWMSGRFGLNQVKLLQPQWTTAIRQLVYSGTRQAVRICRGLYTDTPIFLPRKLQKLVDYLERYPHLIPKYQEEYDFFKSKLGCS